MGTTRRQLLKRAALFLARRIAQPVYRAAGRGAAARVVVPVLQAQLRTIGYIVEAV